MFFLDSTGFFSLICLFVQCWVAWIFAAFFGAMASRRGGWLHHLHGSFVGLGLGLTALSVRFALAHHAAAGEQPMQEGDFAVRAMYGLYIAGKAMFAWYLVLGVRTLCRAEVRHRPWLSPVLVAGGFTLGAVLPTAEWLLLAQAPWLMLACLHAAWILQRSNGERADAFRRAIVWVLAVTGGAWLLYAMSVLVVGPTDAVLHPPWSYILRLNSLFDLVLQVVLAACLIIVAMDDSHRATMEALRERDRLRELVQRDEKLRALSTLVSGVAHEINNPLTAILGFADELAADDTAIRARAAVVVREQAERCRVIVQRMSLLGRRASLVAEPVDVVALMRRVIRGFEPELQRCGVQLRLDSVSVTKPLVADPTGVEQVLTNLIGNALHASPAGGAVTISVIDGEDELLFRIVDRGAGVPVADRSRIFEPFWTTKKEGQGTGLGLAVVDAIVRAHGGRIEVGDAPAGGACFTVHWPRVPRLAVAPAAAAATAMPVPAAPRPAPRAGGNRLLVIDDEVLVRSTIARQARADGWLVVEAASAEQALELLASPDAAFDAIACDIRMPGMSGVAFHDELARRAPHLLSRLLFVTGDLASHEAARFAARCGARFLTKPFASSELLRQLHEVARTA